MDGMGKPLQLYTSLILCVIFIVTIFPTGLHSLKSLKCYRCLALECPEEPTFCNEVRRYVMAQLADLYYVDYTLPDCPKPQGEDDKWEFMKTSYPSSVPCGAHQENEATCTLGRFQVVTNYVGGTDSNVTSHGTVLGCARRKLLESTVDTFKYVDPKAAKGNSTERIVTINKCSIVASKSSVQDSILFRHSMEIEHCSKYTDMCYSSNFCVLPEYSEVKTFKDQTYKASFPMLVIILCVAVIGLIICGCTFAGIKF